MAEAAGIAVHNQLGPQFGIEGVEHAGCNAHSLRDLQGLVENGDEVRAENLDFHLVSAIAAAGEAQRRPKRRKGHNLAIRLYDFQAETKQKISCCFRTAAGAADFMILRSVI